MAVRTGDSTPAYELAELKRFRSCVHLFAAIYIKHNVQHSWAAGYCHCHFVLEKSARRVHQMHGRYDVCIPRRCGENDLLYGHSYRLIEDDWQPFEFQRENVEHRSDLNSHFLSEVKQLAKEVELEHIIAIVPRLHEPVIEELLQKEHGTITYPESEAHKGDSDFITEWGFERDGASIIAVGQKKCVPLTTGEHQIVKDMAIVLKGSGSLM